MRARARPGPGMSPSRLALGLVAGLALGLAAASASTPIAPPSAVRAADAPSDRGESIIVRWDPSPQDSGADGLVSGYRVLRAHAPEGPFAGIGFTAAGRTVYTDNDVANHRDAYYRVEALRAGAGAQAEAEPPDAGGRALSEVAGPVQASAQWINTRQWNAFAILVLLLGFNLYFIERIKRGHRPFIRRIAGLEAVSEAVGRATEMGRPILFVAGTQDMNDIQTVAGVTILGHIARTTAAYDSRLVVPTSRALVMTTARETVKEAYLAAGRPESYDESSIYYVTDEQFGYVAGVNGYMVRQKPATCFYMGAFFAESLILAETGNSIGAIQVAGTAQPAQLPFFVAACDYTLIGEELFAASAYLSGEPRQLGSIKGQDVGKLLAVGSIVAGVAALTLAAVTDWGPLAAAGELIRELWSTELI